MPQKDIIPTRYKPLYVKNIGAFYLCLNPYSAKPFIILNKHGKKLFDRIDGKKKFSEYPKIAKKLKLKFSSSEIKILFNSLRQCDIINYKGKTKFEFIEHANEAKSLSLWINLTNQCNFRCTYCYVDKRLKEEISTSTISKMLDSISRYHGHERITLILAGGEPLLKFQTIQYLVDEVRMRKMKNVSITIVTNGSLLSDGMAEYFRKNGIFLSISFDGIGKFNDVNRILTDGSPTNALIQRAIRIAQKHRILGGVSITVSSKNISGLPALAKYCLGDLIRMEIHFFHKKNEFCDDDLSKEPRKIIQYMQKTLRIIYDHYLRNRLPSSPVTDRIIRSDFKQLRGWSANSCDAGINFFSVTPNGQLQYCPFAGDNLSSVTDRDMVGKARKTIGPFLEKMSVDRITECQNCLWKYICAGGCMQERSYINSSRPSTKCVLYKSLIPMILDFEAKYLIGRKLFHSMHAR